MSRLDLRHVAQRIWSRRWLIAAMALLAIVPGAILGKALPVRYSATTQVLIDPVDLQVIEKGLKQSSSYGDIQIAQVETQGRVLTSQNVLKPVVERLGLAEDDEFASAAAGRTTLLGRLKAMILGEPQSGTEPAPAVEALRALQKRITVRRAERTFVLDVAVQSEEPDKAVRLANAVVESFLEERGQAIAEAARRATTSLSARLSELKDRVEVAERAVQDFKRTHNIVSASGLLVTEQQLTGLSTELVKFRVSAAEAKARYEQLQELTRAGADPGALPEALRSQALAALRAQYGDARGKEGQLASTLLPSHPAVIAARGQTSNIRAAIREEVARFATAAQGEFQRARSQELALEAQVESLRRELTDTNQRMLRLRELERDAQAQRSVYESFLLRTREVGAQEQLDVVNARIISRAQQSDRASWPPRVWQVVAAAMLLAAAMTAGYAVLR